MPTAPTAPTAAPAAPDRSERSTFSTKATAWADYQKDNLVPEMYGLAQNAYSNALEAAAAATVKNTDNFKGIYSALTTYAQGESVYYDGEFWLSNVNGNIGNTPVEGVNWTPTRSAVTAASATVSVTLTASSAYLQTITPTGPGCRFILPDATTLKKRESNYLLQSDGDYPVGVYDSGATLRFVIPPKSSTRASCKSTASAAGSWAFDGVGLPGWMPYFKRVENYYTNGSAFNQVACAILSASCIVYLMYNGSNHLYARAVNPVTGQEGAITLIEAQSVGSFATIFRESATIAAVFYTWGGPFRARGLTVDPSTLAITASTAAVATTISEIGNSHSRKFKQLSAGLYVGVSGSGSTTAKAQACSFSGATPSWGAEDTVLTSSSGNFSYTCIEKIDATRAVVWGTGGAESICRMRAISISGNTISKGNELTTSAGANSVVTENVVLSSTQIAQMAWNGANGYNFRGVSITSGTTLAASSDNLTTVSGGTSLPNNHVGYRLSGTEALFYFQYNNNDIRNAIATFNGTATPTHTQAGQVMSKSIVYTVEPDSDCWPHYYYDASTAPSHWKSLSRSSQETNIRGSIDAGPMWTADIWYAAKLSEKWLGLPYQSKWPRLPVFKKIDGAARYIGDVSLLGPVNNLTGTPAVSGNLAAVTFSELGTAATLLCAVELVS